MNGRVRSLPKTLEYENSNLGQGVWGLISGLSSGRGHRPLACSFSVTRTLASDVKHFGILTRSRSGRGLRSADESLRKPTVRR